MSTKKKGLTTGRYKLLLPFTPVRKVELPDIPDDAQSIKDKTVDLDLSKPTGSRLTLKPITNSKVLGEIEIVKQYLEECGVTIAMYNTTKDLLQNNILPYNPYPGFIRRFRKLAERFHFQKLPLRELKQVIDCPLVSNSEGILSSIKGVSFSIWGLEHIVAHVNAKTLENYHEAVHSSTITNELASQKTEQQISLLVTLSGPFVFNGSIYQNWMQMELKVAVIVTAQDFSVAAKYFAITVMADLEYIQSSTNHLVLDITIPIEEDNDWTSRVWGKSDLQIGLSDGTQENEDLKRQLMHAVMSKRRILLNILLCQTSKSSASKTYIPANKTYNLMFLQKPLGQEEGFKASVPSLVISTLPYQALHEGVFLSRNQAEQYLSLYQKYYTFTGQARRKVNKNDPMHPDLLDVMVKAWQMKIASVSLQHSSFPTVHYMLLLTLAQTRIKTFAKQTEDDLVIQISRFLRGTAARLKSALFYHPVILSLIPAADEASGFVADRIIAKYKDSLLQVVDPELSARSSETQCLKHLVAHAIDLSGSEPFHAKLKKRDLEELADVVSCVTLGLSQDALDLSPAITALKVKLNGLYLHMVPKPPPLEVAKVTQHGVKNQAWIQVDKMKINVQTNAIASQAPKSVASHLAMMQYTADIRIDHTWRELYEALLLMFDHLPPNPYPILVSILRKANASLQSFFETDASAVKRLMQRKIVAMEGSKEMMTVTGSNAFAQRPALGVLHPLGYRQLFDIASHVFMLSPGEGVSGRPIQAAPFQVATCGGFLPPTIHYGSVSPYLRSLDLDEHCFVRGPSDKSHQAPNVLAKIVLSHLRNLRSRGVITRQATMSGVVLKLQSLAASSAARFESEFSAAVSGGGSVDLELFYPTEWRYVMIKIRMWVYFVNENNDNVTPLFRNPEQFDFRSFTVFLHPEDAKYCSKRIPLVSSPPDVDLEQSWQSRDWQAIVTQLSCRGQMTLAEGIATKKRGPGFGQKLDQSEAFTLLAFCWRYSSGIPGQLDYLRSLNYSLEAVIGFGADALEDGDPISSSVDESLLETQFAEYKSKLQEVTSQSCCLSPSPLPSLLQTKMAAVGVRDVTSNKMTLYFDKGATRTLREVNGYILALRNSAAQDLLLASTAVNEYIKSRVLPDGSRRKLC